jgi:superfamily II DNA/RNA helicase
MTDLRKQLANLNYEPLSEDEEPIDINEEPKTTIDTHSHVPHSVHHASFASLSLKPELTRIIDENGFEQPSEVQLQCIPAAMLGSDIICQAKSGMGKTAVFVFSVLHLLEVEETKNTKVRCLVVCHAKELAYQIQMDFNRFKKHFVNKSNGNPLITTKVVLGGTKMSADIMALKGEVPHIVIGTPGRMLALVSKGYLNVEGVKFFIIDECDKVLSSADMRSDVQKIFYKTPRNKQVMMFSATLSDDMRKVCRLYMHNPREVMIDEGKKLLLEGLQQYCVKLTEDQKNLKLVQILDSIEFNQVFVFVKSVKRAETLYSVLKDEEFPVIFSHGGLPTDLRIESFKKFKLGNDRIMVTTDLFHRGMDFKAVNVVINYDFPDMEDTYLHRIGRAGRFGTKGLAISFVTKEDEPILEAVRKKFVVGVEELPEKIEKSSYV